MAHRLLKGRGGKRSNAKGASARDRAEVASGKGSARDRAEAGKARRRKR